MGCFFSDSYGTSRKGADLSWESQYSYLTAAESP